MREYLFRGMTEEKKWVDGCLIKDKVGLFIGKDEENKWGEDKVLPETVGQFSGLFDAKDNKIFEGDICEWFDTDSAKHFFRVAFLRGAFMIVPQGINEDEASELLYDSLALMVEVVGNMHENPELMKRNNEN